tara:strand:+ start:34690 stop:35241 length:552 start_codon:yes stop_codon:yes gene_type:complete
MLGIPNIITMMRIFLIPVFVVIFYLPIRHVDILTAGIFCLAGFTDWLDGFLARKLNQTSRFGAFLDPVADKLIVAVALVMIVGDFGSVWITIPAMIIVGREIMISALREWMAEIGKRANVAVSHVGKVKTVMQMLAIIILLANPTDLTIDWVLLGVVMMYLAAVLTIWSMFVYLKAAMVEIRN